MYRKKSASNIELQTNTRSRKNTITSQKCSPSPIAPNKKMPLQKEKKTTNKQNLTNNLSNGSKKRINDYGSTLGGVRKMKQKIAPSHEYLRSQKEKSSSKKSIKLTTGSTMQSAKPSPRYLPSKENIYQISTLKKQEYSFDETKIMISMFHIIKKVSENKFSSTFEALHSQTGLLFNLKIFNKQKIKRQGLTDRVCEELKFRLGSHHANMQNLFGFFGDEVNIYLIEEFVRNDYPILDFSAQNCDKIKRLPQKECYKIFINVLSTIQYAHSEDFCLRDIRLENLKSIFGIIKITDFSWVTHLQSKNRRDTFCGSIRNAPPELLRGDSYNGSIDIWQLGLLLYTLSVGIHPFKDKQHILVPQNIRILNELNFPIFLSNEIVDLLGKILQSKQSRVCIQQIYEHPWMQLWQADGFVAKQFWNFWALNS